MPKRVQLPDGNIGEFPDTMSDTQIEGVLQKQFPPMQSKQKPSMIDALTEIQPHQAVHSVSDLGREVARGVGNIGAGGLGVLLHPIKTAEGTLESIGGMLTAPVEMATGTPFKKTIPGELIESLRTQPLETIESGIGQAGAMGGLGAFGETAAERIPKVTGKVGEILTKTTPRETAELVKKTAEENKEAIEKTAAENAKTEAKRKLDLAKHFEKTQEAKQANIEAGAGVARKEALTHGVEKLDADFQKDLKETEKNVRAQAGKKYDDVREKVGNLTVPNSNLADAVSKAEKNIAGSSENVKIFRDILSKHPSEEPGFIEYQGAEIPKGHPLYKVLKEQGAVDAKPATFSDLQGYYSELGRAISKGNLPDDVFRALRDLHTSIGNMMQGLSDQAGVGPEFAEARNFYRQYMEAFRDHNSPLYKAIKATERGKSIAALSGKDVTGIETLARYNPELARRANTIRGYQAEARAISSKPKVTKQLPKLGPKPSLAEAETKTIGPEEVREAKAKGLEHRAEFIKKRGGQIAATFGVYRILESIIHGNLGSLPNDFAGALAGYSTTQAIGMLLENPKIVEFLTRPTARDIAQIPPEMRGDFGKIAQIAAQKGIHVDPRFYTAAGVVSQRRTPGDILRQSQ